MSLTPMPLIARSTRRPRRRWVVSWCSVVARHRTAAATARDAGMATAEYALVTLAAAGFAGLLLLVLNGGEVRALLLGIVTRALG
ncbi:MAG: DUF4244 domain-containing protein [Micrococcales bacterium]|nr:DUF4244 domain-containing protein [Micrococcales bacterium]